MSSRAVVRATNNRYFASSTQHGEGVALSYIGSQWMLDKQIHEPKEQAFLEYKESISEQFEQLVNGFSNENITSMNVARNLGVAREWEVYTFFANDDINAPESVFSYVGDDGQINHFDSNEISVIADYLGGSPYPLSNIEGHHMNTVRENPYDIDLAADPDNILLATSFGHHTHLHSGNTMNSTAPEYFSLNLTTQDRFDMTIEYNEDLMMLGFYEYGSYAVAGTIAFIVPISVLLEYYRMKDNPLPWVKKRNRLYQNAICTSLLAATLGSTGYITKTTIAFAIDTLPDAIVDSVFMDILAINSAFLAITVAHSSIQYVLEYKDGNQMQEARRRLKNTSMVATAEFVAFQGVALGFDVITQMAGDTAIDSFIPDPTGAFVATRLGYGFIKLGKAIVVSKQSKMTAAKCRDKRRELYYEQALNESQH